MQVILAIIGVIGGVDLLRLLFVKEDKRGRQVENIDAEIAALQHANDLLAQQLERSHETINKLEAEKSALQEEKAGLLATQACLFDDMCVHKGCRMRKPHPGTGARWYNDYREDPNLGADYLSIDTLIKQDRAERKRIEKELGVEE